jgi:hypothetical protein
MNNGIRATVTSMLTDLTKGFSGHVCQTVDDAYNSWYHAMTVGRPVLWISVSSSASSSHRRLSGNPRTHPDVLIPFAMPPSGSPPMEAFLGGIPDTARALEHVTWAASCRCSREGSCSKNYPTGPPLQKGFATFLVSSLPVCSSLNSFQLIGTMTFPASLVAIRTPSSLRAVLR